MKDLVEQLRLHNARLARVEEFVETQRAAEAFQRQIKKLEEVSLLPVLGFACSRLLVAAKPPRPALDTHPVRH